MAWTFYNASGEALVQHAESEATQAEMEAETAVAHFVPPDLVKNSPGVAKAWCQITAAGALSSPSYNIASVTDSGAGNRTVVLTTSFSTAVYAVTSANNGDDTIEAGVDNLATGSFDVDTWLNGSRNDQISWHVAFGDQ